MRLIENYADALARLVAKRSGAKSTKVAPQGKGVQAAGKLSHSEIQSLPEDILKPIQDIDPLSPTFGEFYYMAGYDPIGEAPMGGG